MRVAAIGVVFKWPWTGAQALGNQKPRILSKNNFINYKTNNDVGTTQDFTGLDKIRD